MTRSLYIREALWATAAGHVDPAAELGVWFDALHEALQEPSARPRELLMFSVISRWSRLQRVRAELLSDPNLRELLADAENFLRREGPEAVRLALLVPNPAAWLDEVEALERNLFASDDAQSQAEAACDLLEDLDDVELVSWYARCRDMPDVRLENELDACRFRLAEQPDTFLPASVYVQAIGHSLRPDLPTSDPELARTAEKYVVLLDEFEFLERDVGLVDQPPLPRTMLAAIKARAGRGRTARLADFVAECPIPELQHDFPPVPCELAAYDALTADHSESEPPPVLRYFRFPWDLPGALIAVHDGEQLVLLYRRGKTESVPIVYCRKASPPERQIEWLPSPVELGLFRAELGALNEPLTVRLVSDPPQWLTFRP